MVMSTVQARTTGRAEFHASFRFLIFSGIASGLLLTLAYPSFSLAPLAWVAFVPLLYGLYQARDVRGALWASFAAGWVFFSLSCYWVAHVSVEGYTLFCPFLALFFLPFGWMVYHCYRKGKSAIFWGSIFWVASEFLRGNILTGFPWNLLYASQAKFLELIQMASVTGAYGVSFLVILINLMLFESALIVHGSRKHPGKKNPGRPLLIRSKILVALGVLVTGVVLVYGVRELNRAVRPAVLDREPVRLAAVQPNIAQECKWDPAMRADILERLQSLSRTAATSKPMVIVWPETSVPGELRNEAPLKEWVQGLSRELGCALLIGTQDSEGSDPRRYYNAAAWMTPERGITESYRKIHLVPYGEFLPFANVLPFLRRIIPIPEDFTAGSDYTIFQMRGPSMRWRDPDGTLRSETWMHRFGAVICFEDTFADLFRKFCSHHLDFMVNLTNDAWFKQSGAAMQHANSAVFRAVENRIHLLRATNTGYTCLIDPYGRVQADVREGSNIFVPGVLVADFVPLRMKSLYNQKGDLMAQGCIMLALFQIFLVVRAVIKK